MGRGGALVVDDLAARKCAAGLGVRVVGTFGLVLRAKARGHLPVARPIVEMLRENGMRLAPGLADAALAKVGE